MFRTFVLALAMCLSQQPEEPASQPADPLEPPQFKSIMDEAKKLGPWEDNAKLESEALGNFFNQYGWKDESDVFARDLVLRVNKIPPWNQRERMEIFMGALQDRYSLSADQKRKFSRLIQQESMRMAINHFTELAPIAMEAIKTRSAGQPFTAEQIARWTKVIRPIAEEGRESVERVTRELARDMSSEQKEVFRRDVKALLKRHKDVTSRMEAWEQGQWKPEDWGLHNDPIQKGERVGMNKTGEAASERDIAEAKARAARSIEKNQPPTPPGAQPPDKVDPNAAQQRPIVRESEWQRYVREFCDRHHFSDEQRKSAAGILADVSARAQQWQKANAKQVETLRSRILSTTDAEQTKRINTEIDKLESPMRALFEELKGRLEGLLTTEQRAGVGAP